MPRHVDREQRLKDITTAAIRLLTAGGPADLTLRRLADELGGSITLVTHFYPNRNALLEGILQHLVSTYEAEIGEIDDSSPDPAVRLRELLAWLMPTRSDAIGLERARILVVAQRESEPAIEPWIAAMEPLMRGALRRHLVDIVPEDELEITVDALRTLTNGVAISAVEHPEIWDTQRQLKLLDFIIDKFALDRSSTPATT